MKKAVKYILCVALFAVMCAIGVSADVVSGQCGDDAYWELDTNTGELIISGSGDMWDFDRYDWSEDLNTRPWGDPNCSDIPDYSSQITKVRVGESITSIGDYSFAGCGNLVSAELGESVIEIGESAFEYCSITTISLPESLEVIDYWAFACTDLTAIRFPSNVKVLNDYAFFDCYLLETIELPASIEILGQGTFSNTGTYFVVDDNNDNYCSIDGVIYSKDLNVLMVYPSQNIATEFVVPDCVEIIGTEAFSDSQYLEHITLNESLKGIMEYAFQCYALESIYIPSAVEVIETYAFQNCHLLESIIVAPDNAYYYSDNQGVLYSKDKKELIKYPDNKNLEEYTIVNGCQVIKECAFYCAYWLKTVIIPDTVQEIQYGAFLYSDNLEKVYFCGDCPWIDDDVFYARINDETGSDTVDIYHKEGTRGWDALCFETYKNSKAFRINELSVHDQVWDLLPESTGSSAHNSFIPIFVVVVILIILVLAIVITF